MNDSFWGHVAELRSALIRSGWTILAGVIVSFCFHDHLLKALLAPLAVPTLYMLSPLEGFLVSVNISFWAGLILSSPLWLYFLLVFFLPALRAQERRLILPFLAFSTLFILAGLALAYTLTLPLVARYFFEFNAHLGENLWSLKETVSLSLTLLLAHAFVFELFVIILFLIHYGLLSYALLSRSRKGVIVAIFIVAAILTPPDVLSQLLLAFPMLILFEGTLLYARLRRRVKLLD